MKLRDGFNVARRYETSGKSDGIPSWHCLPGIRTVRNESDVNLAAGPLTLTKEEASAALNVPSDTLLNLTRTGQLRSILVGKHKRWLLADLREYVENQRGNGSCAPSAG